MCLLQAHAASVNMVIGSSVDATGFTPFPTAFTILCPVGGGANCPETFHPSFTDPDRFWGEDGATNCVTSTDGGDNWVQCAAAPFAGVALRVGSSTNGNVVAAASVAGTCTIRYSTDNAASWTTAFTDANACNMAAGSSQLMICQATSGQCDYVFVQANTRTRTYRSTDNGVTWTQSNVANINLANAFSLYFDGTNGVSAPTSGANGRVVPTTTNGTWTISSGWPVATANYACSGSSYYLDVGLCIFCFDAFNSNYKQISTAGAIYKTFIPTGAFVSGSPTLTALEWSSNISYLVGVNTSGNQAFWVSTDNLSSTILLDTVAATAGAATMFKHNGAIYISTAGTTGAFYRISI